MNEYTFLKASNSEKTKQSKKHMDEYALDGLRTLMLAGRTVRIFIVERRKIMGKRKDLCFCYSGLSEKNE